MSSRFVLLCALGLAGSLFVGYCVYFDRKRRSDPNYKRKVLESKRTVISKLDVESIHTSTCLSYMYTRALSIRKTSEVDQERRDDQPQGPEGQGGVSRAGADAG